MNASRRAAEAANRALFPRGLYQPPGAYRFGLEALLLACLVKAGPGDMVIDLGTGCGAAGLALALRCPGVRVTGLELMPELCRAADLNARRLGLRASDAERKSPVLEAENNANSGPPSFFTALRGDLAAPPLAAGLFDLALANPPFRQSARGRLPKESLRRTALFDDGQALDCFFRAAAFCLKAGGRLAVIYDACRGDEFLAALGKRGLVPLRILPVISRQGQPPLRLLVEAAAPGPASAPAPAQTPVQAPAPNQTPAPALPLPEPALLLHEGGQRAFSAKAMAFCPFLAVGGK